MAKITAKLISTRARMVCALVILNALTILVGGVVVTGVVNGRNDQKRSR